MEIVELLTPIVARPKQHASHDGRTRGIASAVVCLCAYADT